ncbi:uncharacterized protein Tco_1218385 [Tanacetum coccineum]
MVSATQASGLQDLTQVCSGLTRHTSNGVCASTSFVPSIIDGNDPYDFVFDGLSKAHRVLKDQSPCDICGAKRFKYEFPSFCCMNGNTELADPHVPEELKYLFTSQCQLGKMFQENIRAYNTSFSFASMGVKLGSTTTNMTSGLYFFDDDDGISRRLQWPNLDRDVVVILTRVLATNPYVTTFKRLADLGPLDSYRVTLNASVELDQKGLQSSNHIRGNNNITAYKRSIVVYERSEYTKQIQPHCGLYDPLSYVLFHPNCEAGWHHKIPKRGASINEIVNDNEDIDEDLVEDENTGKHRNTVTIREYYCYKFQIRSNDNLILLGAIVSTVRGGYVLDCVNAGETQPNRLGQRLVLPGTFIGGLRDMKKQFLDAMALVQEDGKPDIFLTMTCNPNWPEIQQELLLGQKAQDRPDLIARVFCAKLEDLKECLFKYNLLSVVKSHVYVIEFQKRGLPHAHFLLIMAPEHKITNPDHYDKIVCVKIPDPEKYPQTHELVLKHMMHGPCGRLRPSSPCMQGEPKQCLFSYPQHFNEETKQSKNSYPLYRRRDNGRVVTIGRLVFANLAEGERFYLRVLLSHVPGPTGWDDLYTVNRVLYTTFRRAALERGQGRKHLQDMGGGALHSRQKISPGDVRRLWDDHYDSLSEDFTRRYQNAHNVRNIVVKDINVYMQSMGKSVDDFDLPALNPDLSMQSGGFREVEEEYSIIVEEEHPRTRETLNPDQQAAYTGIMKHVDADSPGVFFIDGLGDGKNVPLQGLAC